MQRYKYQQIKKLKKKLKEFLKNKLVSDIFILGSAIKDKAEVKDIDLIILFKEKDYKSMQEISYSIKKQLDIENLHIEPIFIDELFNEKIFSSIMHEGISVRNNKKISEMLGYNSFLLFNFSLKNLNNIEKVRFAQALYGRKENGLLQQFNGKSLGKGTFLVPVENEHLFRELMQKFEVKFEVRRVFVKD